MLPLRNISYFQPMRYNFWEKCTNSHKSGLGCSTPLRNRSHWFLISMHDVKLMLPVWIFLIHIWCKRFNSTEVFKIIKVSSTIFNQLEFYYFSGTFNVLNALKDNVVTYRQNMKISICKVTICWQNVILIELLILLESLDLIIVIIICRYKKNHF